MTDLLSCPFCGGGAKYYHRDDGSGWSNTDWVCCENDECGCGTCLHETADIAIAAWNRRAPLSALPGEAEVVAFMHPTSNWAHVQYSEIDMHCPKDGPRPIPLVTLASLQAMQARAEKAERERDALQEALKPSGETKAEYIGEFTIAVERYVNSDEEVDDEGEGAMDPYEHVTVPWTTIKEIMTAISERAARTALKGGSNG